MSRSSGFSIGPAYGVDCFAFSNRNWTETSAAAELLFVNSFDVLAGAGINPQ